MSEMESCKHVHRGKLTTSIIGDREVRVEKCSDCGILMIHPDDAHAYLNRPKTHEGLTLDTKELILALLGSIPNRPIFNRTVLMKQAFLFKKEIAKGLDISIRGANFAPFNYGPHSKEIAENLDKMERKGIIHIDREPDSEREIISLTSKGKEEAQNVISHFNDSQLGKLKSKRKAWDQLGYSGILEKVYVEYPAYRVRSRIAHEVGPKRRWDEEPK